MGSTPPQIHYNQPQEHSQEKGFSHIYRNFQSPKELVKSPEAELHNLRDLWIKTANTYEASQMFGEIKLEIVKDENGVDKENRTMTKYTYRQIFQKSEALGKNIISRKLDYQEDTEGMRFIGIFSKNRYQWLVADYACILFGLTSVPLYDTLGIQNLSYCLKQTNLTSLFVTAETIKTLLQLKDHGNLKNIICFDHLSSDAILNVKNAGFHFFSFSDLLLEGKEEMTIKYEDYKIKEHQCFTFSYTSGTTGPPKGAMIGHSNLLAMMAACRNNQSLRFTSEDIHISYLPLPHVMERAFIHYIAFCGAFSAFYTGNVQKIKDDCQFVKPTLFISVPRLYSKMAEGVNAKFQEASGISKCLIDNGVSSKLESMKQDGGSSHSFYDSVVFSKVKESLGGRIRMLISGSSPLPEKTHAFIKTVFCCPLIEGYGQTQNTAAAFLQHPNDPHLGHVGGITSGLEFKLCDIPEMHYTSEDKTEKGEASPRGEIWVRGPMVFKGYYKLKETTDQTITKDGWLKSGDVGQLLPGSNAMKIIDRKKNIFKLQQGEYVASEKVQAAYLKSSLVSEVFLHGESTEHFAILIAVPNQTELLALAKERKIEGDFASLCQNPVVKRLILKELNVLGKKEGLMSFEMGKNIYLDSKGFQIQGILTNTMKLIRYQAKKLFKEEIGKMYKEGELDLK